MRQILHIMTTANDILPQKIISHQQQSTDLQLKIVDLTQPEPDYQALLEDIFKADSINVW